MGPCHSSKSLAQKKAKNSPIHGQAKVNFGQPEQSISLQNSQIPKIFDERQIYEKVEFFLSDIGLKLRSGVTVRSLLSTGLNNEFMQMELAKLVYQKIRQQEQNLKDYHRYIQIVKQIIDVMKAFLEPLFNRMEAEKILNYTNKGCPYLVFTNLLIIFHTLVFHKSVMLVHNEDRWWTKNKNEENLQSLLSLIIEIAGKIKYEYEPKFVKKKKNPMLNSKVYSINSHDLQHEESNMSNMMKSGMSNESRGGESKNKRESDFYYNGVSPHFSEKLNEVENNNTNTILHLKSSKSSEDIVAKYRRADEILEDPDDDEINEENMVNGHKARDCEKYTFNLSPSTKKSMKEKN